MAQHETYSLGIDTNFDSVLKANKAINAMYEGLKKVDTRFSGMHAPRGLPAEINHMSAVTASYVQRLQAEGKTYEANKVKSKAYAESLNYLNGKQKALETQLGKIAEKSGKTSETYKEQQVRINATATSINRLQKEQEKLHPTGFNWLTNGAKKATTAIDKAKTHMHNAFNSMKAGAGVAAAGIGAIGATAMSGAKMAGTLQQRYREINNLAVLGGEKQREVTKSITEMQRQGRDMSIKYGKSQQEIAAGYEDLVKRGYTTKQAVGALKTELQASVASGDKFSDVTTVSSQVLDAFGMKANSTGKMLSNTRKVVNELAYSADATSTGFGDLGTAMSYVGTAAKANNIGLAETASALGVLSNNGLESDKAGTALRATINGLTNQINKIGKKNSIFDKLGIKKSEMLDAHGNLKSLSTDMGVLYKHIEEHSKGGSDKNGFFKSIFGTSGMNGAMILAKSSKEVEGLTKRTEKAGKTGTYVAKLAAKNMGTAQGSANSAKQAMNAFKMTLGNAVLPAINQASNALAKFLLSKDGKKFQKDVGGAVAHVANGLVKFIKWGTTHKGTLKAIGRAILAGYTVAKGLKFIAFLGDVKKSIDALKGSSAILNGIADATKAITGKEIAKKGVSSTLGGLFNKGAGAGKLTGKGKLLNGSLQSIRSAGGLKGLTGAGRLATGVAGAGVAIDSGASFFKAFQDRHSADKRSQDIGKGIGAGIGGGIGLYFGGPLGAALGAKVGGFIGKWGGEGVNQFTKGWQRQGKKQKPQNWVQWLGFEAHNSFDFFIGLGKKAVSAVGKAVNKAKPFVKKNWKGLALTAVSPMLGIPALLYKNNPKFHKWANNAGKTIQNGFKATSKWVKDLPSNIHKGWNNAIKSSHNFFKNLPKNFNKAKKSIGKWASKTGKDIGSAWRKGQKATVSFVKHIPSNLGKAQKSVERWGRKTGKNIGSAWHKGTTAVGKFVGSIPGHLAKAQKSVGRWTDRTGKSIHGAWNKGKQGLTSFVTSIPRMLGKAYSAVIDWAGKVSKTVKNAWNGFWGKAGDIRKGVTNNVKAFGNDLSFMVGHSKHTFKYEKIKSHASGGRITATHHALVGEAGPELAYKRGSNARLLGARGPQIARVHAGEHILNARDTAKVLSGGLGTGVTLKGYASGTDKLKKTSKSVTDDYKAIASKSTKSLKKLTRSNKQAFKQVNTDASKQTKQTKTRTVANFKQMHHGITKQMDAIHDGVIRSGKSTAKGFGGAMDKMHKYAHSAMADTTHQLNRGISSIDKVLGQFGGNNSVIKPIKFAKGTDQQGRLTHNTLAMVNDATQGPRQEALVSPDNRLYLPKGQNVQLMLPKGWGVLNGRQTQQVTGKVRHFAKGSGMSHSALRKLADHASTDPAKWFKSNYTNSIKQHGSDLNKGTTQLGSKSSTKFGNPWSNAMWSVINNAIGGAGGKGGSRESFLKYAESTFTGVPYQMGAMTKKLSDCSGMVAQALRHFDIDIGRTTVAMQSSSGVQYLGKSLSKTLPGDLVIFGHGTGAAGHVGIIKNPRTGTMFNETPPRARVTRIADDKGMGYGYYRVRGLHNASSSSKKKAKPDKRLEQLAKRELGSRAIKWIKDNLGDDFGSLGSFSVGGDLKERARALAGGLKKLDPRATKAGIAAILGNWNFESGGLNPSAVNSSGGASGLGQWLGGRLTNLKAYARRHGTSWKNAGTQLSFAVKGEGSDSAIFRSILEGHGSVASLANRFSAEWERGGYNAQHVRGAMQVAKALGFAKGGKPTVGKNVIVGEHGPEIARFTDPVHIYSNEKSKKSLDLGKLPSSKDISQKSLEISKLPSVQKASTKKHHLGTFAPVININFNGSASDFDSKQARKIAEIVQRELEKVFNSIDEEFC